MSGILYGIGIGPGDPELLTIKGLRIIQESDVVAIPGTDIKQSVAYKIVKGVYPQLDEKKLLAVPMPMTKDPDILRQSHDKGADMVEQYLKDGKQVAFLTLGDPTVYSTYLYIHERILKRGYGARIISGVPSFCAVAARLNIGFVEKAEALHVIPATYDADKLDNVLELKGTKVLMKIGKKMSEVREHIIQSGRKSFMVENCGMPDEKVYESAEAMPQNSSYYSLIIVRD